jgi:hypothetical protein
MRFGARTFAPAADAFSTSFMHCWRLSVRLDVERICPIAYRNTTKELALVL